jgi:hypothetical protein
VLVVVVLVLVVWADGRNLRWREKNEMAMIKPWLRAIFFSRFIFAN